MGRGRTVFAFAVGSAAGPESVQGFGTAFLVLGGLGAASILVSLAREKPEGGAR